MSRKNRDTTKHRHHRKCKVNNGCNQPYNISMVPKHKHRAFHLLFDTNEAPEIARILNDVWINTEWELIAIRRTQS